MKMKIWFFRRLHQKNGPQKYGQRLACLLAVCLASVGAAKEISAPPAQAESDQSQVQNEPEPPANSEQRDDGDGTPAGQKSQQEVQPRLQIEKDPTEKGPTAEGPTEKPLSEKQRVASALDELERELNEKEKYGKYGHPQVEAYVRELELEYQTASKALSEYSGRDVPIQSADGRSRQGLIDRSQQISMLLWYLERVGAQIASPNLQSSNSMMMKIHRLMQDNRKALGDAALMKRFHDLTRRASQLNRLRYQSRLTNNFYFARPDGVKPTTNRAVEVQSQGQQKPRQLMQGPIQEMAEPIGRLVQLGWSESGLKWDEGHWDKPFAGWTLQEVDHRVIAELESRQVKIPEGDRSLQFQKKQLFETPRQMLLFQDMLHIAANGNTIGHSISSSNTSGSGRFTAAGVEAAIKVSPEKLEFSVRELSGPERALQIRQSSDNELRLSLIGEHILLLEQADDGSIRWVDIGEKVTVVRADSFAKLYAKHPDLVENELYARLNHCGVGTPLRRYDAQVVDRMLHHLRGLSSATRQRFDELVSEIDGGSFSQRQSAYRELAQDLEKYSTLLAKIDLLEGLSTEAATRLEELHRKYKAEFHHIDAVIETTGWATRPGYLIGLLDHVDQQATAEIFAQLRSATGKDFGGDQVKWQQWLQSQVE